MNIKIDKFTIVTYFKQAFVQKIILEKCHT